MSGDGEHTLGGGHGPVYNPTLVVWRGKIVNELTGEEDFRVEPVTREEWDKRNTARKRRLAEHDLVESLRLRASGVVGLWRSEKPRAGLHAEYLLVVDPKVKDTRVLVRDRYVDRWRLANPTMLVHVESLGAKRARSREGMLRLLGEDR